MKDQPVDYVKADERVEQMFDHPHRRSTDLPRAERPPEDDWTPIKPDWVLVGIYALAAVIVGLGLGVLL